MGEKPEENRYGVHFSQLHALELADMDGDGLKDIVVGKRFWAHGNHGDPEPNAAPVLYWFQLKRNADKTVDFIPHLIDDNSGVGTQVVVGDVNGDGLPDVIVGNKKGTFVHIQEKKSVSSDEWEKAQPKENPAYVEPVAGTEGNKENKASLPSLSSVAIAKGVLPLGKDGKPLNLDFEDGTLKDWTATGDAFKGQPYKGEIDQKRKYGAGRWSNHQGDFWIGGYEILEDAGTGTLTSVPFKVTHPFAAFLFNGGSHAGTRIELVRADTNEIFFKRSGNNNETMERIVVDLAAQKDREIFIRLVDEVKGGWGHVNFDDFRFYETKPEFSPAINPFTKTAVAQSSLPQDQFKYAGVPPEKATKIMTLPPGFHATLFAGEPDVVNPIAFCIDDRGRLWVVEGLTYPRRAGAPPKDDHKDAVERHPRRQRPHPRFRGHERHRPFRQAHRFHGRTESRQRHRKRFRRHLRRRRAVSHVHPGGRRRRAEASRPAADFARRLRLRRHARDAQHFHVGTRRLALRLPRRLHAEQRRQARRARQRAHAHQRRRVAFSSGEKTLRAFR
jgi:hypothetical protein